MIENMISIDSLFGLFNKRGLLTSILKIHISQRRMYEKVIML